MRGKFVRGLKQHDFEVLEDGVSQAVGSLVSEDAPLELVLAIDISGSMEQALPEVKVAVKHLLSKLRPGDAATLIGFNDTTFLVAESETDPQGTRGCGGSAHLVGRHRPLRRDHLLARSRESPLGPQRRRHLLRR